MKIFVTICSIAFFCLIGYKAGAQNKIAPDTAWFNDSIDISDQLIPLDSVLDICLKHSPTIKFQQDVVNESKYQVDFIKRSWTSNVVGFVNYSGGNQSIVAADATNPGGVSSSSLTSGFRGGVQVNIPLYEFVGRKPRISIYQAQVDAAVHKKTESEISLNNVIINLYYSVIQFGNLVKIRSATNQTAKLHVSVAEKEFRDGIINAGELSRVGEIAGNAAADFEFAKKEFSVACKQLEQYAGVPMLKLMKH